jgi:lipid II:glycine glycyltransferase (peptidoglycan interpeptide bridge formation enzyme)
MASFKSKTRYNIRLAQRKGIEIIHDSSPQAFKTFQRLTSATTQRQKFYAHDSHYRQQMWQTMHKAGLAELFLAKHKKDILAAWIIFKLNDTIYYPYGASSDQKRNLMAPNLLCWEIMRWGKKQGFKTFDLWGSLGTDPNTSHPWFGFHRFKLGYAPKLVEYIGTFDLIVNNLFYYPFRLLNSLRWFLLRR